MKEEGNMAQSKEQKKSTENKHKETEVYDLPEKEFKITVIKMFHELRTTMHEQNENINKAIENILKEPNKFWS